MQVIFRKTLSVVVLFSHLTAVAQGDGNTPVVRALTDKAGRDAAAAPDAGTAQNLNSLNAQQISQMSPADAKATIEKFITGNCKSCHVGTGDKVKKFGDFKLRSVITQYLDFKNPKNSELYKKLASGDMPETTYGDFIDPKDLPNILRMIERWIQVGAPYGANGAAGDRPAANRGGKALEVRTALEAAKRDSDPRNVRFISLGVIANNPDLIKKYKIFEAAVSKLVNSLSVKSNIVVPKYPAQGVPLLKINISDYGWRNFQWDAIEARYNYTGEYLAEFQDFDELRKITNTRIPIIRGDWFLKEASQPPLYHEVLRMPGNDAQLEEILKISTTDNIRRQNVLRAGFVNSGVSQHNRIIERHSTQFGAYWKSYDFSSSEGRQNILINPLGPIGVDDTRNTFQHAGGEIIYNLPNGLQAYLLVDAGGRRLDKAPSNIVSDPSRPDRLVTNGLSCMGCHDKGIIIKADDVLDSVTRLVSNGKNQRFFPQQNFDKVKAMYDPRIQQEMQGDVNRFIRSMTAANAVLPNYEDPINHAVHIYEANLSPDQIKLEFGLSDSELDTLKSKVPDSRLTQLLVQAGARGMKRDLFERVFFRANEQALEVLKPEILSFFQRQRAADANDPNARNGRFDRNSGRFDDNQRLRDGNRGRSDDQNDNNRRRNNPPPPPEQSVDGN